MPLSVFPRRPLRIVLGLVAIALIAPGAVQAISVVYLPFVIGVAEVQSADTYWVSGRVVTLWGVDAPGRNAVCESKSGKSWPCGRDATNAVAAYLKTRPLRCEYADRAPGVVAWSCLTQPGNGNLALWLISNGWAVRAPEESMVSDAAQRRAQEQGLGLWKTGSSTRWK